MIAWTHSRIKHIFTYSIDYHIHMNHTESKNRNVFNGTQIQSTIGFIIISYTEYIHKCCIAFINMLAQLLLHTYSLRFFSETEFLIIYKLVFNGIGILVYQKQIYKIPIWLSIIYAYILWKCSSYCESVVILTTLLSNSLANTTPSYIHVSCNCF